MNQPAWLLTAVACAAAAVWVGARAWPELPMRFCRQEERTVYTAAVNFTAVLTEAAGQRKLI